MTDKNTIWKRKMTGIKVAAFAMAAASAAVLGIRFAQPQNTSVAKDGLSDYETVLKETDAEEPFIRFDQQDEQLSKQDSDQEAEDGVLADAALPQAEKKQLADENVPADTPALGEAQDHAASEQSQPALQNEQTAVSRTADQTPAAPAPSAPIAAVQQPAASAQSVPDPEPSTVQLPERTVEEQSAAQTIQSSQEMEFAKAETDPTPAAPASADDGIWHIQYFDTEGASSAPSDGSIGKFADGWFIMHSSMPNGEKLKTMPQQVEVDGQIYQLADSWVSDDGISEEEVARIRANNGITFQTCIDDTTNLMVHYNPVNGAGYPYNFENFPYTYNDGLVFGYGS